jgi:ATP synthase protein I
VGPRRSSSGCLAFSNQTDNIPAARDNNFTAEGRLLDERGPGPSPLRGIGTFGMIGWSIAVPTVGGAFLGLWLDRVAPQNFSWAIALILGGVVMGAFIAWGQISKEGDD